ncbi:MAG: tryptophan transporter [Thermoanaerobacteraceae bacterium]|nr:tryptophan transporter [Thermoanaerobacteraceae bacterium]
MSLRDSVQVALLLGIGALLHVITPQIFPGIKPDPFLGMLFVVILLKREIRAVLLTALVAAVLGGLTGSAGMQVPNMIDKFLTTFIVYLLIVKPFYGRINDKVLCGILGFAGTLISGLIFLSFAMYVLGFDLGGSFGLLFATIVVPTALFNTILVSILYPVVIFSKGVVEKNSSREIKN